VRASFLLGRGGRDRAELLSCLRSLAGGEPADDRAADAVRRALVEALLHGDRAALASWLDEALLGVRPGPTGYYARVSASGPQGAASAA
jgi:hypothetical protein